jgi:hypothetical protein
MHYTTRNVNRPSETRVRWQQDRKHNISREKRGTEGWRGTGNRNGGWGPVRRGKTKAIGSNPESEKAEPSGGRRGGRPTDKGAPGQASPGNPHPWRRSAQRATKPVRRQRLGRLPNDHRPTAAVPPRSGREQGKGSAAVRVQAFPRGLRPLDKRQHAVSDSSAADGRGHEPKGFDPTAGARHHTRGPIGGWTGSVPVEAGGDGLTGR